MAQRLESMPLADAGDAQRPAPVSPGDAAWQEQILPHVSRTFALTIPQLPPGLRTAVTNAYLLCRIADTIEDEPGIGATEKAEQLRRFTDLVHGQGAVGALTADVVPRLGSRTLAAERELVAHTERALRVLHALPGVQQRAIQRCIRIMCHGMHHFQTTASVRGLPRRADLDAYCYYVAGVVGETLTELFASHTPELAARRERLYALAASFGQGLQMTNILKDCWEDRARGACWLPQEVFAAHGLELAALPVEPPPDPVPAAFGRGMQELVASAHGHLRNALEYCLLIPATEPGIRRFCLWAVGLAVLTLQRIHARPGFRSGREVKISRRSVAATRLLTNLAVGNDRMLRLLHAGAGRGLPSAPPARMREAAWAASIAHLEFEPRTAEVRS